MKYTENTMSHTQIDLLRHGECAGGNIFRGHTDAVLTATGEAQMASALEKHPKPWQVILTSPLSRCREFAETTAQRLGIRCRVVDDLKEMSFGDWDGCNVEDVWQQYPDVAEAWSENPQATTPPNGEPLAQVAARAHSIMQLLIDQDEWQNVLLISHGGFLRTLLCQLLDAPINNANRWHIPYASFTSAHLYRQADKIRWQIAL